MTKYLKNAICFNLFTFYSTRHRASNKKLVTGMLYGNMLWRSKDNSGWRITSKMLIRIKPSTGMGGGDDWSVYVSGEVA